MTIMTVILSLKRYVLTRFQKPQWVHLETLLTLKVSSEISTKLSGLDEKKLLNKNSYTLVKIAIKEFL